MIAIGFVKSCPCVIVRYKTRWKNILKRYLKSYTVYQISPYESFVILYAFSIPFPKNNLMHILNSK